MKGACNYHSITVVGEDEPTTIQNFLNQFHALLEVYYFINKLVMNETKTKFLVHKHINEKTPGFKLTIKTRNNDTITDDNAIKVLGFWINKRGNYQTHLQKKKALATVQLKKLRPLTNLIPMNQRKIVIKSKIMSILEYGAPLFSGETDDTKRIFHTGIMNCYRAIKNKFIYMESCKSICAHIGEPLPLQKLELLTIIQTHKLMKNLEPKSIMKFIKDQAHPRKCKNLVSTIEARTIKRKRSFLYKLPQIFNQIPHELKMLPNRLFKKRLEKYEISESPIT